MSGGSFSYLYNKDPQDLFAHEEELEQMRNHLRKYHRLSKALEDTERILKLMKMYQNTVEGLMIGLKDVWYAVEWHVSGDYAADQEQKAIDDYQEKWGAK